MKPTIFIAIASFRDMELTHTIWSARSQAMHPERLSFGVVQQARREEMAHDLGPDVRHVHVLPEHSYGLGWARAGCFALYRGEDYLLQVDSHTLFEAGWDETLIGAYDTLPDAAFIWPGSVISSYPMPYTIESDRRVPQVDRALQVMEPTQFGDLPHDPQITFRGVQDTDLRPKLGIHLAGGFIFAPGRFVEDVPYDPYLYFRDEQAMTIRAWTRGWNIWHMPNAPLYHRYFAHDPLRPRHSDPAHGYDVASAETRAADRIRQLLAGNLPGAYGLGTERTLADFAAFSGIDYPNRKVGRRP